MTEQQFEELKNTMPWRTMVHQTNPLGGLVQMIDRNGAEVPLFAMCEFLNIVTENIAKQRAAQAQEKAP
jgi:hypothetical protein